MQQFEDAVTAAVRSMSESGAIQKIIEAKVGETVERVIGDAVRPYSDFGKALEKAVEGALKIDASQLGLAGYNHAVLEIVRRKLESAVMTAGAKQIEADLDRLLSGPVPAEISLSKLVDDFKEWARDDAHGDDYDSHVTVIVEPIKYSSRWIYFDKGAEKSWYDCAFSLLVREDGTLSSARIGRNKDVTNTLFLGELAGFERTLFQMHTAKTRIVVDTEEPDTWQPEREW
ncbi:hypothetical protein FBZ84_101137 [Azospirillum baldaniorum]|uniref:hypothetical protein n=1 Tax=Azospirillum baldaniorum TaxID=1064539 RepID=UPI0011A57C5F|nr:hypothetical protein [Azospirillum baldaniorum]TWA71871.1 hypothetical protein FBZ84_101137 [Azospirillum baldaniorum]